MNKEEILAKARQENKNQDIYEKESIEKASTVAARVGMLMCCILEVLEVVFTEKVNYSIWAVYFVILSTTFFGKFFYMHKKHELAVAIIYLLFAILFVVLNVLRLVG